MHPQAHEKPLDRAAGLWGIEPQYWDIWGRLHVTSDDTKRAILAAMGVPTSSSLEIADAVDQRVRSEWERLVPPCLVIDRSANPFQFSVNAAAAELSSVASVAIRAEDGREIRLETALCQSPEIDRTESGGVLYFRKTIPLPDLDLGYYDLSISVGARNASMRLIVAPDRAWSPQNLREGGIAVSLYGVRSAQNWGCGDFRDLRRVTDWVAKEAEADFIALNPLHAIPNRRPYNTSPYLPTSIFYQNHIYLDVEAIPEFAASAAAQRLWADPKTRKAVEDLRNSEYVEYESVNFWKLRFLRLCFIEFLRGRSASPERSRAFRQFIEREGERLERFATYCALDEWIHKRNPDVWIWPDWPEPYRDPDSAATRAFRGRRQWRVLFYQYVQWQIDEQLAGAQKYAIDSGLKLGLYHDLALATDRCGSDLWAYGDFFVAGCRVGSPPDDFAPKGQDWAFPPPNSLHHRETGYRLFAESIRNNCRHGGALRIDHVMRLFRLYWITDGSDATQGAYVRDQFEDLVRILALESVRNKVVVVGEDLGTVEPFIRETLQRFGVLSYRLFYFERQGEGEFVPFQKYPPQALVSSTTHDLPTLAGFWISEDIEARRRAGMIADERSYHEQMEGRGRDKQKMLDVLFSHGLLPPHFPRLAEHVPELTGELHNAVIGFLASSPSQLLLVNQEDLTKEISQQNLPGTTSQYPNWSRKMKFSVEQLLTEKQAIDFTTMFRHWLIKTGRH